MASEKSFGVLKTREGVTYLALTLPTLITQSTYSIAMYSASHLGAPEPFNLVIQLVGVTTLILMVFSVAVFRPTLTMFMLGISFFVVTLLPKAPTPDPLIFLTSLFLLSLSFNFGRSMKIRGGRAPEVYSSGPLHLRALSLSLNGLLPIAASIGLVALASYTLDVVKSGVASLPYPLSDIVLLYLNTRVGFVSFILLNAGILLWVIREFLEPAILYYSLDGVLAGRLAVEQYEELKKELERKFLKRRLGIPIKLTRPSRGALILGLALMLLILVFYGPTPQDIQEKSGGLLERMLGGIDGKALVETVSNFADYVDSSTLSLENLIRYLVRIIWGG